jgi:hypothetical protein
LETFAILFSASTFSAVAPLEMPQRVIQSLFKTAWQLLLLAILSSNQLDFRLESIGVPNQNLFFGLESVLFMIKVVKTATTLTLWPAQPIVGKTLTVQFEAFRLSTIARLKTIQRIASLSLGIVWFQDRKNLTRVASVVGLFFESCNHLLSINILVGRRSAFSGSSLGVVSKKV